MRTRISIVVLATTVALATMLTGCETFGDCHSAGCSDDAVLTAHVQHRLDRISAVGPPGTVHVETIKGVVYLTGTVDGGVAKRLAESTAKQTPHVTNLVNSIDVEHE